MTQRPFGVLGGNRGRGTTFADYLNAEDHSFRVSSPEDRRPPHGVFVGHYLPKNLFGTQVAAPDKVLLDFLDSQDVEGLDSRRLMSSSVISHLRDRQEALINSAELKEALQDLKEVTEDAEEDGLEVPSEVAFTNAERLLRAMYRISPRRYGVYPVSGGRIAIDARGPNGRIAVLTCESDGGALCLVTIDGEYRRARYSTARGLPDGFIREALAALDA